MISIVISVYNEEDVLQIFFDQLQKSLKASELPSEIIFVNDGSRDNSSKILHQIAAEHPEAKVITFSRNFGHESAMLAGIDNSSGEAVICMDADLQHPPEKIPEMVATYRKGKEVVNMIRIDREDGGRVKRFLSRMFYKLINKISPVDFESNASDFFLISRQVAEILKENYRECSRFLRGYVQLVGFNKTTIEYTAVARKGGSSKYSLYRLFVLSLGAVVSFSKLPLHLGIVVGSIFGLFSLIVGGYSIFMKFAGEAPPGYTTLVVFMSFSFSIMFFLIGIIGIYIGYNFDESKKRPIYIVHSKTGFDRS